MTRLLSLRAVARRLSCSRSRIRQWRESGQFPSPVVLPGGVERWRVRDLDDWLARCGLSLGGLRLAATTVPTATEEPTGEEVVDLSPLRELSLEFLQALAEGESRGQEWMNGASVAAKIGDNLDHTSGTFKRSRDELRDFCPPLIETNRTLGYRLTGPARRAIASGPAVGPKLAQGDGEA